MFKLLALLLGTAHAGTYMDKYAAVHDLYTISDSLHTFSGSLGANANFANADLANAKLIDALLYNTNLQGAQLQNADLSGADLSGADLSGADLTGAYLSGADLSGADLSGADLSDADLSGFRFGSGITVNEGGLIECPASRQELRSAMNDKSC